MVARILALGVGFASLGELYTLKSSNLINNNGIYFIVYAFLFSWCNLFLRLAIFIR